VQLPSYELYRYPNRPHNHSETLPFHVLFQDLFNRLNENKKPTGPLATRKRQGPHGGQSTNPHEVRRAIIERFISRWRREVGDDIYPAFRLIIPEKDRERAMYGLKEKALGKFLVKIMKIDKNSEDGFNLLNWKLPGQSTASRMAGDFAGRCFEIISKRPVLTEVGNMTIGEVNDLLDQLSAAAREENQLPIMDHFYRNMNAEELMWLIRVILRQMKVGATERTFFELWHPDAESLFNVSSSLRRVCWELYDPSVRREGEDRGVTLMQCFQPQLAQFQMHSFQGMVAKMRPTEDDQTFWIEEKLDGERMQLHMMSDDSTPGSKKFAFWSRKAKDYTYLYGNGFQDENGSLTRHLKAGFADDVDNIILDGEMITWDPEQDAPLPFGTLKAAALSEQRNPFANGQRPLFRIFDILYLNDHPLTRYTLRDRRRALERSVVPIHRRFEIHDYKEATKAEEIEPMLREVVAQASEGLVLKNPRSAYRLNERNDDWMKVKPEYMTEFGESLDCVVIGGYYGSGKRGGALSSFLCGLRVDKTFARKGEWNPMKFRSFFRVGGGMTAMDYANIRHHTDGKWIEWDSKNPPTQFVELAGGPLQIEKPDVWIKPSDSVVVCVKAASVTTSDQFASGLTLRFARFKRLRMDKTWESALSIQEFLDLKTNIEKEQREKEFQVDDARNQKSRIATHKKPLTITGYNARAVNEAKFDGPSGKVFEGLTLYIMTESTRPEKKTKVELEEMVKANGGRIVQTHNAVENTVCVAERRTVKVASLEKRGGTSLVRPTWLFDCITQSRTEFAKALPEIVVPLEVERHLFFIAEGEREQYAGNVDEFGDSYARDTSVEELKVIMDKMGVVRKVKVDDIASELSASRDIPGWMFAGLVVHFDPVEISQPNAINPEVGLEESIQELERRKGSASWTVRFGGGLLSEQLDNKQLTHVIVHDKSDVKQLRKTLSTRPRLPWIVTRQWIEESWRERTLLDEERFAPL
jgi:DNA ligase 4